VKIHCNTCFLSLPTNQYSVSHYTTLLILSLSLSLALSLSFAFKCISTLLGYECAM
jgi:4-hydroxybenzoate polyprenyltransferase